jgi:hypothetical protein
MTGVMRKDIRAIVRTLVAKATAGDPVAAKLVLLWAIGRPADPVFPDAIARLAAVEAQADQAPPPRPAAWEAGRDADLHRELARLTDPEARLNVAARALSQEIRILRGAIPAIGEAADLGQHS